MLHTRWDQKNRGATRMRNNHGDISIRLSLFLAMPLLAEPPSSLLRAIPVAQAAGVTAAAAKPEACTRPPNDHMHRQAQDRLNVLRNKQIYLPARGIRKCV